MAKAAAKKTENEYDVRRETLVVERKTTWPANVKLSDADREFAADLLHKDAQNVKQMVYVRCPTGLIRHITVTDEEMAKLKGLGVKSA